MRLILFICTLLAAAPALACGPDTDCTVGNRSYRLALPDGPDGPLGALVFAHGHRGTAAGEMRNRALRALATDLGMAFVALQSDGPDWKIAHTPQDPLREEAREYDYVRDVLADLGGRVTLDPARVVMTGFSAGGMLTWTLACGMSDAFAGFVALSGTFWAPVPDTCTTPPANLVHIHGTADKTVPLSGRAIGQARQGEVGRALAMYDGYGAFGPFGPDLAAPGDMMCRAAENAGGKRLEFCTFDGGHGVSIQRLRHGIARVLGGS